MIAPLLPNKEMQLTGRVLVAHTHSPASSRGPQLISLFDCFAVALEYNMPADALDFLDWLVDALAGWRYLFSPSFRRRTNKRWKVEGWSTAFIEFLFGGLGVIFTLLLLWVLIALVRG